LKNPDARAVKWAKTDGGESLKPGITAAAMAAFAKSWRRE